MDAVYAIFRYEDLEPFYDLMDIEMGVSGLAGDPAYPPMAPPPLPPHPIGAIGRKAAEGMNELGWHWWPASQSIPSRPYRGLSQCVRRGTCMQGCPEQAKASMDLTHWPDAIKAGAQLITGARVRKVSLGPNGRADGAVYVDRDGVEQFQGAENVILLALALVRALGWPLTEPVCRKARPGRDCIGPLSGLSRSSTFIVCAGCSRG
ncbi:MAG: GMC family oxidoreductase N-terminal domain-containing protein [Gammaproteobacteria bacterium]